MIDANTRRVLEDYNREPLYRWDDAVIHIVVLVLLLIFYRLIGIVWWYGAILSVTYLAMALSLTIFPRKRSRRAVREALELLDELEANEKEESK